VADPFTPHTIRFDVEGCKYLVLSEQVKAMCIQHHIPEKDIQVFPMILDEKYNQQLSKEQKKAVRKEFGIKPDEKVVLIVGGGEGIPNGNAMMAALLSYQFFSPHLKFLIVCGKNERLYQSLQRRLRDHSQAQRFQIL
jgi:UDP-N-acetylglucosamine:LPS N-acetylglucosamine transferase